VIFSGGGDGDPHIPPSQRQADKRLGTSSKEAAPPVVVSSRQHEGRRSEWEKGCARSPRVGACRSRGATTHACSEWERKGTIATLLKV
jgi:hypothetical protein